MTNKDGILFDYFNNYDEEEELHIKISKGTTLFLIKQFVEHFVKRKYNRKIVQQQSDEVRATNRDSLFKYKRKHKRAVAAVVVAAAATVVGPTEEAATREAARTCWP